MKTYQPNLNGIVASTVIIGSVVALGFIYQTRSRKKWSRVGTIDHLFLYPIKGIPGIELFAKEGQPEVWVTPLGLQCGALRDRSFIFGFYNNKGEFEFITMRSKPKLALITVTPNSTFSYVTLSAPGMPDVDIYPPQVTENLEKISLELWGSRGEGYVCNTKANEWFNQFLEKDNCILLFADKGKTRGDLNTSLSLRLPNKDPKYGKYAPKNMELLFSDDSPLMMACDSSHKDVNRRLMDTGEPPVDRRCWKANVWVKSLRVPFDEDMWEDVRFKGGPLFKRMRPCYRCMVTTVDYETGTHRESREPLKILGKYRQHSAFREGPLFGSLLTVIETGPVQPGMDIFVTEAPFRSL